MEKRVSAADANRKFSQLLRTVRQGRSYVVTDHGKPVAKIVPITAHDDIRLGARKALMAHLRSQPVLQVGKWSRDELYEDGR
jgi:prevent-host-death family protein